MLGAAFRRYMKQDIHYNVSCFHWGFFLLISNVLRLLFEVDDDAPVKFIFFTFYLQQPSRLQEGNNVLGLSEVGLELAAKRLQLLPDVAI
ncbi:hypothetical protein L798_00621 [Zootermopsis nevadensis]|uniref:Uncharacterized protein n=1 Tax=Zootermopsis nevadensis TaxID=136037 RepID=A0A067RG84_ZOONE|nr:hypothetical protein L798_00621 [Zootermopsis nevadensis]